MITTVLLNGDPSDGMVPVTDSSVLRGDGCFEVLKSYGGRPFALQEHLDRLERSATALGIGLPHRDALASWVAKVTDELGDGAVRIVVTRGSSVPGLAEASNVIVFGHPWPTPSEPARLLPVTAPWHAAGVDWALAGAKTLSYAPNMSAKHAAESAGFDDALLVTTDHVILEGTTFSVAWMVGEILETPVLDLGILDSITRRVVLGLARELGIDVVEGIFEISRLEEASELMAISTIREVQPVAAVGERTWGPGPASGRLAAAFRLQTR